MQNTRDQAHAFRCTCAHGNTCVSCQGPFSVETESMAPVIHGAASMHIWNVPKHFAPTACYGNWSGKDCSTFICLRKSKKTKTTVYKCSAKIDLLMRLGIDTALDKEDHTPTVNMQPMQYEVDTTEY